MAAGWIALGSAVVGAGSSRRSGKKQQEEAKKAQEQAIKDAERIAEANAEMIRRQADETFRRMDREQDFRMGSARAGIATSGVEMEGTPANTMKGLEDEYVQQRFYQQEVFKRQEQAALEGSIGAGSQFAIMAAQAKYQSQSDVISSITGGITSAANAWWL